jgi:hypothetical protein
MVLGCWPEWFVSKLTVATIVVLAIGPLQEHVLAVALDH